MSPPYSQYAKLILKGSHNYGANLDLAPDGSQGRQHQLQRRIPDNEEVLREGRRGYRPGGLEDGKGATPRTRSPPAATEVLRYWLEQPQAKAFRETLPVMGVDGSLSGQLQDLPRPRARSSPRSGRSACSGFLERAPGRQRVVGGYLEVTPGRFHVFYLVVNGAKAKNVEDVLKMFNDINNICAILQEDASNQGGASKGDQ